MSTSLHERRLGALFGAAVGDALGVTHEFKDAEAISPARLRIVGGGPFKFAAGEVSDDTDLLLAVLAAYPDRNRFDPDLAVQNMLAWVRSGPPDVGIQTRSALLHWQRGHRPHADEDAQGNGGLMRAAAHALACDNSDLAAENARSDTMLTHPSNAAGNCSAQMAFLLSHVLAGEPMTDLPEEFGNGLLPYDAPIRSSSGYCVHSLRLALWALDHSTSFEHGIDVVIKTGGDTDTNAAIAGALLGAKFGFSQIPLDWRSGLMKNVQEQLGCEAKRLRF